MESESLSEETHVKKVSLFTSPSIQGEKDGIIVFRIFDHTGDCGTLLPEVAWLRFDSCFLDSLFEDRSLDEDEVYQAIAKVDRFGFATAKDLARELCCYMRSCYGFYEETYFGMDRSSESTNDFLVVIVVEAWRTVVTENYLAAKLTILDQHNRVSLSKKDHLLSHNELQESCDDDDDMGCNVVHDDDDDMGSVISSGMHMHMDDDDDGDDKGRVICTDIERVDDGVDDNGDDDAMEEEDGNIVYDDDKKVIECVKYILCQEIGVPYTYETPIELVEVKPKLTIEEMKVEIMDDGNFKPLIDSIINTKLSNDDECSICISSFAEKLPISDEYPWCPKTNSWVVVKLNCGHVFHHGCIFEWLSKAFSCPLCRSCSRVYV